MRGIWHQYQFSAEHIAQAEEWQRRAIALDPDLARAHMALARTTMAKCLFGYSDDVARDQATTAEAARRAIALDARDPYCHYAMFLAQISALRHDDALAEAQRAIDLNPNFAYGHFALGWARLFMGHFEQALDPLLRALRLSPSDPLAFFNLSRVALVHYHLGNAEEALHFAERALAVRRMHVVLTAAVASLGRLGRLDEAAPLAAEMRDLTPADPEGYWRICYPYADPANRAELYDGLRRAGVTI